MDSEADQILLPKNKSISPGDTTSEANLELKSYGSGLELFFLDCSSLWRSWLSFSIFFLLNIGVPLVSHFVFSCSSCDRSHQRPYDAIVQLSLSVFTALSFASLSYFSRKYGLRKFLFLDKLCDESEKVRQEYTHQLKRSTKLLSAFVLPSFLAVSVYKIWWFSSGGTQIPYLYNIYLSKIIVCLLLLCSWLYRTSICFLVCVLFRLTCYLQILRLEDFARVFERETDVASILIEHLRIRRNLRVISHRFRLFILSTLILVTLSQFVSLFVTTKPRSTINIATAGELAVCSITLVMGLFVCLRIAAKITHKAQAITSLAAKWHVCATISAFDELDGSTPTAEIASSQTGCPLTSDFDSDSEEDTNLMPVFANTISYQKRQALVTYFEHNKAGITVYGFMLDRSLLHMILAVHLTLTLWILNKTIGIS